MRPKGWWWGIGILMVVGLTMVGVGYWWFTKGPGASRVNAPPESLVQPLDPREVARGLVIYQTSCAVCHGANAEGQPNWRQRNPDGTYAAPPHDSTGHTWHHSDGLLYRIVRDGGRIYEDPGFKSMMPAFGDRLNEEEIRAVMTYLKSLWGPRERAFQAEVSREDPFQ